MRIEKRIVFWLLLTGLAVVGCEFSARVVFSFLVGPAVLVYGTGAYRTEVRSFPSVVMAKVGYTPPTPEAYQIAAPHSTYTKFSPHEIKSDKDQNGQGFHPKINSRGFRGKEFSDRKKRGTVRVVTLGASSTFGYHNQDDETYPFQMEALLNERARGKRRFEVINLGIPHMDSERILSIFLNEALPLQPDVVTFYEGWNDAGVGPDPASEGRQWLQGDGFIAILFRRLYVALNDYSLIAALLDSLVYYAGERDFTDDELQHYIEAKTARLLGYLSLIEDICSKNDIVFILANQQARSQMVEREQAKGITYRQEVQIVSEKLRNEGRLRRREAAFLIHSGMMKSLRQWSLSRKVPFVDVIHALDHDRSVLLTYVHPNPNGNRIIAEEFTKEILKHF